MQQSLDKLINARRAYQYKIIAPTDFDFEDEINEWGENGWEIIYMRRASGKTTTGEREARYEITMKKTIIRGPFDPEYIPPIPYERDDL